MGLALKADIDNNLDCPTNYYQPMPPNLLMYKISLRFLQSVTGKLEEKKKIYISIIQSLETGDKPQHTSSDFLV